MFLDPAIGSNFFDRQDILDLLKKRVNSLRYGYRQNIAIIGPPYYGKTSIIFRFINDIQFKDVVPIYIDVKPQGFLNFAEKFISALLFQYLRVIEYKIEDAKELIPIANDRMPKTTKAIKEIEALIKSDDVSNAYTALFELPAIAYAETNLRPIIIMDEFHRIEDFGIEDAFSTLGKYIMFQKDTMYIVASSYTNLAKKILSEKLSLLFGNFEIYELGTFDVKTAFDFIDFKLREKKLPKELNSFLVAFTDGHPFYLDCILLKLKEYLNSASQDGHIEVMTKTFAELLFDSKGILNQHFAISISDLEKIDQRYASVLLSISNGNRRAQSICASLHLKPNELRPILQELVNFGWALKYGVFYVIRDKVFEFWLKNVHQSKECRLDVYYESKISRFKVELKNYIEEFLNVSKQNHIQTLVELLSSFNRELILLDKRYFVFPSFKRSFVHDADVRGTSYLVLSSDKCEWAFLISLQPLTDDRVTDFLKYCRKHKRTLKRKIIISPCEMDANTKLLAKEAKAWIWTLRELNELLDIAGKQRLILPDLGKAGSVKTELFDVHHLESA
ncbi:MAG: ATP-binding protein [Candidatus Omnitrophota bacterium]